MSVYGPEWVPENVYLKNEAGRIRPACMLPNSFGYALALFPDSPVEDRPVSVHPIDLLGTKQFGNLTLVAFQLLVPGSSDKHTYERAYTDDGYDTLNHPRSLSLEINNGDVIHATGAFIVSWADYFENGIGELTARVKVNA